MRSIQSINQGWAFTPSGSNGTVTVDLPHTWNNLDGQDGTNGYVRDCATYRKQLEGTDGTVFLEVLAANSVAKVFVNGVEAARHRGGYSAFYVDLTGRLVRAQNELVIEVSNAADEAVYPTMADFTFYGGLYRGINLIRLPAKHFDVTENGKGVFVTPVKNGDKWMLEIDVKVVGTEASDKMTIALTDAAGVVLQEVTVPAVSGKTVLEVKDPVLWQGVENPYLYTVVCRLEEDEVKVETGFRTIEVDAEKGLYLNGKPLKLKGVSRHQDRENMGNAITFKEHAEDVDLILEVGANAVRLAHYQQNDDFYTLCDRKGLLVWAEVPVISRFSKKRQANAVSQLTELITQARNHPSIFCWGIANELTIGGEPKGLYEALVELNAQAKRLDSSRLTTIAQVSMCPVDSRLNAITDLVGYNHYFGWYAGTYKDLDRWLQKWRAANPDKKLCLSEYGAEGIVRYQGDDPVPGDYSEGYQAKYHENYITRINAAEWMWGSFVWNMFDFGSAMRNEGGVRGRNNKGLVTFDRKLKKDAFYLYKAYWSDQPFVYLAGRRYAKRPIGETTIKVYSNLPEVTLRAGGKEMTQKGDKVFVFPGIAIAAGENVVTVAAGDCRDEVTIEGVSETPADYRLPSGEPSMVRNWFNEKEGEYDPTCFSLNDKVGDLLDNAEIKALIAKFAGKKANSPLIGLLRPFRVRTLLKLPFVKLNDEMINYAERYLQTIKK